jgi:hypothetical protein
MGHRAALGPNVVDLVLDDVERRTFLVKPAGEHALELSLWIADVELQEGAGELLLLPGRGGLAGAQTHDRIFDAERLPRLHRQVARDAVALVQEADDGDALGHRRSAWSDARNRLRHVDCDRFGLAGLALRLGGRVVAARRGGDGCTRRDDAEAGPKLLGDRRHDQSGVQAS